MANINTINPEKSAKKLTREAFLNMTENYIRKTDGRAQLGTSQYMIIDMKRWKAVEC